jgi:RsiW-degrading membrane proteinase PrsW (M82 family)
VIQALFAVFFAAIFIAPVVGLYLLVIKGVDRYEPEPWWLLGGCFFWGVFGATFFAIIGNQIGLTFVQLGLGDYATQQTMMSTTASFVAPPVEESTKGVVLLAVWALSGLWLKELDGPLDGAIYGGMVGLGFTLTEDVLYVSGATMQQGALAGQVVFILRTIMGGLGHATFTAMTGLGVGIAAEARNPLVKVIAPVGGWSAAVGLHFLHNFLVTFLLANGLGLVIKLLVFWTFDFVFFVMLYVLVIRDRAIVIRGLVDEVGRLLHPLEFRRTTSYSMVIPLWNIASLIGSPGGYFRARRKQLDLVKLAFVKQRILRGEREQAWADRLRDRVRQANAAGVFIGAR